MFFVVKTLGAIYLCWIGIKALREAWVGATSSLAHPPARSRRSLSRAFVEGFLTNALNPKVSMFYLAAFPQFVSQADSAVVSSFVLVFIHSLINLVWFSAMVLLFARLTRAASNQSFQRWLKSITGLVFVGFGARLATIEP